MEEVFQNISAQTGFPADQLKYISCLLMLVPLSIPFRLIHNANFRHLYSVVSSFLLLAFCLGAESIVHSLFSSTVCYLIMRYVPHGTAHRLVFIWMMLYLSVSHIYRMATDWMGWSMDFTGPQMVLTIKMTTLAINYYDGNEPQSLKEKMRDYQKAHMIENLPSLLEFFGFVYFFPSFLAGPAVEVKDYLRFVNGTLIEGKDNDSFPLMPLLKVYRNVLLVLPIVVLAAMFVNPTKLLLTEEYAARPLYERMFLLHVVVAFSRHKYYFAWYLAETGFVATGFSWNGRDKEGHVKWDRATNSYPLKVEFPENVRGCVENWNIVTQTWLKNYLYLRLSEVGWSTLPCTVATYTTSAFWHGFYPGYYVAFVTAAFVTELGKDVRRKIRPYFMQRDGETPKQPWKQVYDIFGIAVASYAMNYSGLAFILLVLTPVSAVYSQVYWGVHVGTAVLFVLLRVLPTPKNQPMRAARK